MVVVNSYVKKYIKIYNIKMKIHYAASGGMQ